MISMKVAAMLKFFAIPVRPNPEHRQDRENRLTERLNVQQQLLDTERRLTEFMTPSASQESDEPDGH